MGTKGRKNVRKLKMTKEQREQKKKKWGESKRGGASLMQPIPLPLIKGKGIKGIGLINLAKGG